MIKRYRFIIGLVISAIALWVVFCNFQFSDLVPALKEADYRWLAIVFPIYLTGHLLRSLRWKVILSPIKPISAFHLFPIVMVGFFMNSVLPARGGEFVRAYVLQKRQGIPFSSGFGTIVAERLMDLCTLCILGFFVSSLIPLGKFPLKTLLAAIIISLPIIYLFLTSSFFKNSQPSGSAFRQKSMALLATFVNGFSILSSAQKVVRTLFLSLAIWTIEILTLFFVSRIFHLDLSFSVSSALMVGLCVGVMVPAAPGYVGTYEFFGQQTLAILGYSSKTALPFILFVHVFQLLVNIGFGLYGFLRFETREKKLENPSPLPTP